MEKLWSTQFWYHYIWERLGDSNYRNNFRENYEGLGFSYDELVRVLESQYGPIQTKEVLL